MLVKGAPAIEQGDTFIFELYCQVRYSFDAVTYIWINNYKGHYKATIYPLQKWWIWDSQDILLVFTY